MKAGSQPLGTGTTFFNMMDFVQPSSQQTPAATPPATTPAVTPTVPAAAPAAAPSIMSYADWAAQNPMRQRPLRAGGHNMGGTNDRNSEINRKHGAQSRHQNQYMMEMIRQLGGLPEGSMNGRR